ncbi:hypothetical protein WG66_005296 [Moniliophthora roreri]|nr:hypothetical protein WG66_005296 [Moniliophthora roreri]
MLSYTHILLIGLFFVQTSLAKGLSCRCTNNKRHWDPDGTAGGCAYLRASKGFSGYDVVTSTDAHGTVMCNIAEWIPNDPHYGKDWDKWWTHYVCIDHQKLSSGQCY